MSFETLSERYEFDIPDFPQEWLPLTYLYDPDLPLFPVMYFHELSPDLPKGQRPGARDRVFGYIHHINLNDDKLTICLATNKRLNESKNHKFKKVAEDAAKERLGLQSPVVISDIDKALTGQLTKANNVLKELWYQVIDGSFGDSLPFGKLWDPVLGLARFLASWNSEGGRKGELIQTHCFVAEFGEKIPTGSGFHADFYLLPTWAELTDISNPISLFPKYAELIFASKVFVDTYCDTINVNKCKFSAFKMSNTGKNGTQHSKLKTETVLDIIKRLTSVHLPLFKNYSAFNRGPQRSVISLMMLNDLRNNLWNPAQLTFADCAEMYVSLQGSYQSPKVIQLYAQQCFGVESALPIDNWVESFVCWPLGFKEVSKKWYQSLFCCCSKWGRIERLVWIASQSRKVHSSVCADILWCIRYGDSNKKLRGANPLGCKLCSAHIRDVCPQFLDILDREIVFNSPPTGNKFSITTSHGNNSTPAQSLLSCEDSVIKDEYSVRDHPEKYALYPVTGHSGTSISVKRFLELY